MRARKHATITRVENGYTVSANYATNREGDHVFTNLEDALAFIARCLLLFREPMPSIQPATPAKERKS